MMEPRFATSETQSGRVECPAPSTTERTIMDFPGTNSIELNMATVKGLLAQHLGDAFKVQGLRTIDVSAKSYGDGLEVKFTTDPKPKVEEA